MPFENNLQFLYFLIKEIKNSHETKTKTKPKEYQTIFFCIFMYVNIGGKIYFQFGETFPQGIEQNFHTIPLSISYSPLHKHQELIKD